MRLLVLTALALFALTEPAYAQAWAQKAASVGDQIVNGRKRFSDMMNWFVGAAVFLSVTEVVNLIFGS